MSAVLEALRQRVASARGLPEDAVSFLGGDSVTELEASANALAKLRGTGDHGDPLPGPDPFGNRAAAKAERQARILRLFAGPPRQEQPRDVAGRYTSFDGRARPATLTSQRPESHGETILRLAHQSKLGRSGF